MARRPLLLARWLVPAALALAAAGCGDAPRTTSGPQDKTLREAFPTDFRSFDPAVAFDSSSIPLMRLVCQSLLDYDDIHLVPLLAEDLPTLSADRRTYTFKIRKGVLFSNGRELTADDFIYTWERVLDPKTKSPCAPFLTGIVGAEDFQKGKEGAKHVQGLRSKGDYILEVELAEPDPTFPNITAMLCCCAIPKEDVEHWGKDFNRHPSGTGPYLLKEWVRGVRVRFVPNPRYSLPESPDMDASPIFLARQGKGARYSLPDKPKLDAIEVPIGPDSSVAQMMFERRELDIKEGIPPADFARIRNGPEWQPYITLKAENDRTPLTENATYYLTLNCQMAPFTDKRVRQAFSYAIDKDRLTKITNGRCEPAHGVMPPNLPGYNPDVKQHPRYPYDPAKAKQLLADAGHAHDLSVSIMTYSEGVLPKVAESVQYDLRKVGVTAEINVLTSATVFREVGKKDHVACSLTGWGMDYPDPKDFLDVLYKGGANITEDECNNVSFFDDPEVNKKLEEAAGEADLAKRYKLYQEAEKLIIEEAPTVFLFHPTTYRLHQPWVKGDKMDPVWIIRYDRLSVGVP